MFKRDYSLIVLKDVKDKLQKKIIDKNNIGCNYERRNCTNLKEKYIRKSNYCKIDIQLPGFIAVLDY